MGSVRNYTRIKERMAVTKPVNAKPVNVKPEITATTAEATGSRTNTRPLFRKPTTFSAESLSPANLQNLRGQFREKAKVDPKTAALLNGYNKYTPATAASAAIKNGVNLIIPSKPQRQVFFPNSIPTPTTGGRRKTRRSKKRSKKTRRRH
jgi:hypothetical protein